MSGHWRSPAGSANTASPLMFGGGRRDDASARAPMESPNQRLMQYQSQQHAYGLAKSSATAAPHPNTNTNDHEDDGAAADFLGPSYNTAAASSSTTRVEVERLRQELASQRRDAARRIDELEVDRRRLEAELHKERTHAASLQQSLDSLTASRNKESRDRTTGVRQAEELRAENARLRKDLAAAIDTRLSHLRTPAVSFEQYRALLATAETLAAALRDGGQLTLDGGNNALQSARSWADAATAASNNKQGTSSPPPELQHLLAATTTIGRQMSAVGLHHNPNASSATMIDHQVSATTPSEGHSRHSSATYPALSMVPPGALPQYNASGGAARGGGGNSFFDASASQRGAASPSTSVVGGGVAAMRSARESQSQLSQQRGGGGGGHHRQPSTVGAAGTAVDANATAVRESIVDGGKLIKVIRDAAPHTGKHWSFQNLTQDLQFVLEFTFGPQSEVTPIGDTEVDGRTYRVSIYPGEAEDFVRGSINGYRMSIRYGPPDSGFVPSSSLTDAELLPLVDRVKGLGATSVDDAARECVAQGLAFVDVSFPPLSKSMAKAAQGVGPVVRWERPDALVPAGEKAEVAVSGFDAGGPTRGQLDDPWLVSAMAVLAPRRVEILRAFSLSTTADQLAGLHRVQLCLGGWWCVIAVDSYIPCVPRTTTPFGARCRSPRDVWAPLLEKAMAKAYGSYLSLIGGDPLEAIADIAGAAAERLDWRAKDAVAFGTLLRAHRREMCVLVTAPEPTTAAATAATKDASASSVLVPNAASTSANPATTADSSTTDVAHGAQPHHRVTVMGFKPGHAYLLLAAVHCDEFRLCLVSNPEGAADWNGAWSPKSEKWQRHPAVRAACDEAERGVAVSVAGGVWIEWRDVAFNFAGAGIVSLRPDWLDVRIANRFNGVRPQWIMELSVRRPTTVIIGVHQRDRRSLPPNDPERGYSAFLITVVACSDAGVWDAVEQSHGGTFWRGRDVNLEVQLTPRDRAYYIIPRRYTEERSKDVTVSLQIEHKDAVVAALKQPTEEAMNSVRYSPVWKFDPLPCPAVHPMPEMQVDRRPAGNLEW